MADKSGIAEQVIGLPKGGAAVRGLGETFAPDLHTGTGNFSVPLALPAGRGDMTPQLSLRYTTGAPNGPFGLGWQLTSAMISRRTSARIPRYRDDDPRPDQRDEFLLDGDELVLVAERTGAGPAGDETHRSYRARSERAFLRVLWRRGGGHDEWEVTSRDGMVSRFGTSQAARVVSPGPPARVFAWLLSEAVDVFGNRIVYRHRRDDGGVGDATALAAAGRWHEANRDNNQSYLIGVNYLDHRPPGTAGDAFLFSVDVDYGQFDADGAPGDDWDYRGDDAFSTYRAGFEVRTVRRCRRLLVRLHEPGAEPQLVRSYELGYRAAAYTGTSLLTSITHVGYAPREPQDVTGAELPDGTVVGPRYRKQALPPLRLEYTELDPSRRDLRAVQVSQGALPVRGLGAPEFELVDLDGRGPGVLDTGSGGHRYWGNRGGGRLAAPHPIHAAPNAVSLEQRGVRLADVEGNGRSDLVVLDGRFAGYYPTSFRTGWDRRSFQPFDNAPSADPDDGDVQLVDMDGSGRISLLETGRDDLRIYYNQRRGWDLEQVPRGPARVFPDVSFARSGGRVRIASIAGGGASDIVELGDGRVDYWPHLGYGRYGGRITMRNAPRVGQAFDARRLLLVDVDGDGYADLVYPELGRTRIWMNRSGNAWSDPIEIAGTPFVIDVDAVRGVDLLGTGTPGLLWSFDRREQPGRNYQFLDLTGGRKPYLLTRLFNGMGCTTEIEYRSSSWFQHRDDEEDHPWLTALPFPVHCVARVMVYDELSHSASTTEYRYHHGCWHGGRREFRGFACVDHFDTDQRDRQDPTVPLETRTWFHLGDMDEGAPELDLRSEYWPGDRATMARPAETQALLAGLDVGRRREAVRALQGRVLRTELYVRDRGPRQDRPMQVTESVFGLRLQDADLANPNSAGSVFGYLFATRTTRWERGDDPMTEVTISDDHDAAGQARQATTVHLPRRQARRRPVTASVGSVDVDGTDVLATHTRTRFAVPDGGLRAVDRVASTSRWALRDPGGVAEPDPSNVAQALAAQLAAASAVHERFRAALDPWTADQATPPGTRILGHVLHHYDGAAFAGRSVGQAGPYGVLSRSEALVFEADRLDRAYGRRLPAALGGQASPPAPAPPATLAGMGYRLMARARDEYLAGHYTDTQRQRFDVQDAGLPPEHRRGMRTGLQDALGHETTITPDPRWAVAAHVVDALGLVTSADYDYRTMQPERVVDPNGHATAATYSPLGFVTRMLLQGREGEGGTLARPEVSYVYDVGAFLRTAGDAQPQPVSVTTRRRVRHAHEQASDAVLESREYVDGLGRTIQRRATGPRLRFGEAGDDVGLPTAPGEMPQPAVGMVVDDGVVVSGWKRYDSKGRAVEQFEPFLGTGWAFQPEAESARGHRTTFEYDGVNRLVATRYADGSEQRTVYGVPAALDRPGAFEPTPWELFVYDPNDLAPECADPSTGVSLGDRAATAHHFTPTSRRIDASNRVVATVQRTGGVPAEAYLSRVVYDLDDNPLELIDPLGRVTFRFVYDLLGRRLRTESLDAGLRTSVLDAENDLLEYRDAKDAWVVRRFDAAHRLTRLWARHRAGDAMRLRERRMYGDEGDRVAAKQHNQLGRLTMHWDEAGRLELAAYDFKANALTKVRRVVSDAALAAGWSANWAAADAEAALAPREYRVDLTYDALDRRTAVRTPEEADGQRALLEVRYGRSGNPEHFLLDGAVIVDHVAHNARGQRVLLALGNGTIVRHRYDARSHRLLAVRSEPTSRAATPAAVTWQSTGAPLQDLGYAHDLVGNVLGIDAHEPGCGIAGSADGPDRLRRTFGYDSLYRLIFADGRACVGDGSPRPLAQDRPGCPAVPGAVEAYDERYTYDPLANVLSLDYDAPSGPWTRRLGIGGAVPGAWAGALGNRLTAVEQGGVTTTYRQDRAGNMLGDDAGHELTWDHADRLGAVREATSDGTEIARFVYDADGVRVKRLISSLAGSESKVFIDGFFEHATGTGHGPRTSIHVLDGASRIAVRRRGSAAGDAAPDLVYILGDHLDSSHVVLAADGARVDHEEYFPYGETSAGGYAGKAHRFTGKERDPGPLRLYYSLARYYAPWLARWISCDPAGGVDGPNLYAYVGGNPMRLGDPTGTQSQPSRNARELIAGHPEAISRKTGWETILAYPNPTGVQNTATVGSPVHNAVHDAEATMTAANVVTWISLGAFGVVIAAEMGAGAALVGGKQMIERAALKFAIQNPRTTVAIAGYLAAEAGLENPMPAGWASLGSTLAQGSVFGIGSSFVKNIHGNSGNSPKPTVLYALFDKATGLFLKWGVTSEEKLANRYSGLGELVDPRPVMSGTRAAMLELERFVTERIPGLWNREGHAGAKGGPQTLADSIRLQPFLKWVEETFSQPGVRAGQWGPPGKRGGPQ